MSSPPLCNFVRPTTGFVWAMLVLCSVLFFPIARAQRIEVAEKDAEAVTVETASISTEITGRIAVTTLDLTFRNPNARALEGTFVFSLLEGQSVTRFALDINGVLREAVPIEKNRGRVVFEEIERQNADPGLLEQAVGNVYRARVYPLPARGTRRVRISYQEDLALSNDQTWYRLNLDFPRVLKHFRLAINVHSSASFPGQARTTLDLQLPPWRDGQFMEMERDDFDARGVFEISLLKSDRPKTITGRFQGKEYFYTEVPSTPLLFNRPTPRVVGLLWDSSATGGERNHEREFALLAAWFADLKNVEVRLVRLRDRATKEGTFTVRDGDWHVLRKELEATVYDGATSLDGLTDDPKVEAWLLFSDGFFNYGATAPSPKLALRSTVHTVQASTRANALWLRAVASNGKGEYVNLVEMEAAKAAFTLEAQSMRVLNVDFDPRAVSHVFPKPGTPILGDSFVVTGVLRKKEAKIHLVIGDNKENAQPVEILLLSGDDPSDLAARAWAATKIDRLSTEYRANREEIQKISREFGIVTPDTSLVVLDSVDDYIRYNIRPPEDMQAEWQARQSALTRATLPKGRDEHLESVVELFQQHVAWWEKNYPSDQPKAPLPQNAKTRAPSPVGGEDTPRPGATRDSPPDSEASPAVRDDEVILSPFTAAKGSTHARASAAADTAPMTMAEAGGRTSDDEVGNGPQISLQRWSPQNGYMDRLRRAKPDDRYAAYLEERPEHLREPGFFIDCADFFFENNDADTALRVLSNLAELELDDPALLRVLAYRLNEANRPDLAAPIFEQVLLLRPEEPQSRRDLALAYAATGKFQKAVDLLWEIVSTPWDSRFPEIELIALEELNAVVATCGQKLDLTRIDPRLLKNLPMDLRVILSWDANDCDIDLWVVDPNAETAKYDFPLTYQGGRMSSDFTGGYGPEEFTLRRAKPGKYLIKINYYGDRRQTALGPVTAQVRLITGFGTPAEQEKRLTVRLKEKQETLDIGAIELSDKGIKSRK